MSKETRPDLNAEQKADQRSDRNQPTTGDTAKQNIARQQETKVSTQRTGAGETSTSAGIDNGKRNLDAAENDGQVNADAQPDIETGAVSERNSGAPTGDDRDTRNH